MRRAATREEETVALTDEADLIRRAQYSRADFAAIYDRYVDRVYRYAYARAGDHAAAQDVAAETFRRALEALGRYEPQGKPFAAWLFGIAANVLRERARALTGTARATPLDALTAEQEPSDGAPPALDLLLEEEEASALWRLVDELPVDARRMLIFRYAWSLSYTDIADRLGRSEAACKQLAYRALKDLRRRATTAGYWNAGGM